MAPRQSVAPQTGGVTTEPDLAAAKRRVFDHPGYREHVELDDRRLLVGRPHGHEDLVFTGAKGGPLRHSAFYRCHFKPAVIRAGLHTGEV